MSRGKVLMLERGCEFCGKPLPRLRHPNMKFCNYVCFQRNKYQLVHGKAGLKCLDCGKVFTKVGSHVVQVHGYETALEYRREHGLMQKETRTEEHAEQMRSKVVEKSKANLVLGKDTRFVTGGEHPEMLHEFWENRKLQQGYKKLGKSLWGDDI